VETTSPQFGEFALSLSSAPERSSDNPSQTDHLSDLPRSLLNELWLSAKAESSGLTLDECGTVLYSVGRKFNYGFPAAIYPDASQKTDFVRSLRLEDLALATACPFGRELAWRRFLSLYRAPLTQAAVAITGSATLGHELAESLYSEIYGLREVDGERRSPLASYSGRGSLLGWLRTTLAQRHVDHHRRTHRETPLDTLDAPAPQPGDSPAPAELARLTLGVARTLQQLTTSATRSCMLAPCNHRRGTSENSFGAISRYLPRAHSGYAAGSPKDGDEWVGVKNGIEYSATAATFLTPT
jgi:DNA-directed RNA polymerase specialized sigma24 family protein